MNCSLSMFLRSLGLSRRHRGAFSLQSCCNSRAISQSRCNSQRIGAAVRRELKRNLLLTVVGTVEARDTSRDMDNVQMIGTKITAIKEYLYVRHPHCMSFIMSAHLAILRLMQLISRSPSDR